MTETEFEKLNLSENAMNAIKKKGFKIASEVQVKVIPLILEQKHDIMAIAQTGTGKTGAFGLPLIDIMQNNGKFPECIILTPTRELAIQVCNELKSFIGNKHLRLLSVYGGASINQQIQELKKGINIVVGTPGRVLDLTKRGDLNLKSIKYFILDEADEMLNMGFIEDIEEILENAKNKDKKIYLFSATMPERIKNISKKYMNKPKIVEVERKNEISDLIEELFYYSSKMNKLKVLKKIIREDTSFYGIVFCRTKSDVTNLTSSLREDGYNAECIHGDIIQSRREKILDKFRKRIIKILIATDVVARGIDVDNLTYVVNYSMPNNAEQYTHRIGRTGRAGNNGKAVSIISNTEIKKISEFERELNRKINITRLDNDENDNNKQEYQPRKKDNFKEKNIRVVDKRNNSDKPNDRFKKKSSNKFANDKKKPYEPKKDGFKSFKSKNRDTEFKSKNRDTENQEKSSYENNKEGKSRFSKPNEKKKYNNDFNKNKKDGSTKTYGKNKESKGSGFKTGFKKTIVHKSKFKSNNNTSNSKN